MVMVHGGPAGTPKEAPQVGAHPMVPFLISDDDWKSLQPSLTEGIGLNKGLSDEQIKFLDIFRAVDRRSEWACRQAVINRRLCFWLTLAVFIIMAAHFPILMNLLKLIP
jgi:hypothetical protein